jgi:hypothetical protein
MDFKDGREMITNDMKQTLNAAARPKLRLVEVERLIKVHRIIVPPLSRATLVNFCEDGTFETAGTRPTSVGWLVFEDSFWKWAHSLDG